MKKEITVTTSSVYEPRALAELVGVANDFSSSISIIMDNRNINAKSIMGMMSLGLMEDDEVVVTADGADETEAVESMAKLLNR